LGLWDRQDPKKRITLPKVMRHSWVTKAGEWPLRTIKELLRAGDGLEEEGDDADDDAVPSYLSPAELPDMMATHNVLDVPQQASLNPKP
jgi:hypothetical protein